MTQPDPNAETANAETTATNEAAPDAADDAGKELTAEELKAALAAARREAAATRVKLREAEPFVTKAREAEEANKTEAQRLTEAQAAATKRADKAERELNQLRAAQKVGLDLDFADRLRGSTPEELEADARSLAEKFGGNSAPDPGRKPRPRVTETPPARTAVADDNDPNAIAQRALKRSGFSV